MQLVIDLEKRRVLAIDGLRGLCILSVCFVHLNAFVGGSWSSYEMYFHILSRAAVEIFFCVSGYLLFKSLCFRKCLVSDSIQDFYRRRFFRIYPLWFVAVTLYWYLQKFSIITALSMYTFTFGFFRFKNEFDPILQAWSLFCEECFYVMLPLLFFTINNLKKSLIAFFVSCFIYFYWIKLAPVYEIPNSNDFINRFPLAVLNLFLLGIVVFWIERLVAQNRKILETFSKIPLLVHAIEVLLIVGILAYRGTNLNLYLGDSFAIVFVALSGALLPGSFLNRIFSFKYLRSYGVNCYSIYLFHILIYVTIQPFLFSWINILGFNQLNKELQMLLCFPIVLFIFKIFGDVVSRWIERPIMAMFLKVQGN